jgi:hypothetical protein
MLILLLLLVCGGALLFLIFGNTDPVVAMFGGVLTGFILWLIVGVFVLVGSAFDSCHTNTLDPSEECLEELAEMRD